MSQGLVHDRRACRWRLANVPAQLNTFGNRRNRRSADGCPRAGWVPPPTVSVALCIDYNSSPLLPPWSIRREDRSKLLPPPPKTGSDSPNRPFQYLSNFPDREPFSIR